jgi:hypothetical protein
MRTPSFERIDYQIRSNKHIERQLIFDRISKARTRFDFSNYTYIGFGSVWFVDFRMAHRRLGINRMMSIEHADFADRAAFNAPLGCIEVVPGEASKVLKKISNEIWSEPTMCWLDYDGCLDLSVVDDLATILDSAAPGSVLLVSLNANFQSYRPRNVNGPRRRENTARGQIETILSGITVPPRFNELPASVSVAHPDIAAENFPEMLAVMTLTWMMHRMKSSKRTSVDEDHSVLELLPLFNYFHKDGADMVTVGGVIIPSSLKKTMQNEIGAGITLSIHDKTLPIHERIDLVPMTLAEKSLLDTCLPRSGEEFIESAKKKGIKLSDENLLKYQRYYREFPVFLEMNC